jgi:hypothetical protein
MISSDQAKRIGRGRTIALSYAAMTGLTMEDGIDTAVVDCIADLLHAACAEPFERAGLEVDEKQAIAEGLARQALDHLYAELGGEDE